MPNIDLLAMHKLFLGNHIKNGSIAVDFTMGNGHDTAYLAEAVGPTGHVYAFDIQEQALEHTRARLTDMGLIDRCTLILDSHANALSYISEPICAGVFNLGYLPSGDHNLATKADSTLCALEQGLTLLKKGGLMTVCIYSGGDSGFEERNAVLTYLKELDPRKYLVIVSEYYNRPKHPPIPVLVVKLF